MQNCPKCQSEEFKKLSLIYADGTSSGKSVGVGVTGGGSVAVGVGASASITQLATKCAPPVKSKGEAGGLVGAILVMGQIAVAVATGAGWFYFFLILIPGMIYVYSCSQQEEKQLLAKHNAALEDYNQKYLCLRCETIFNPFATKIDTDDVTEISRPV